MITDTNTMIATLFALFVFYTKPGPGYIMEVTRLLSDGLRIALSIAVGAILSNCIFIWAVGLGVGLIGPPIMITAIQVVAGVYLILYTVLLIFKAFGGKIMPNKVKPSTSMIGWFFFGLLNGFVNPVNLSFYTTVLPEFSKVGLSYQELFILNAFAILFLILGRFLYYGFAISFKRVIFNSDSWRYVVVGANLVFLATLMFPISRAVRALFDATVG